MSEYPASIREINSLPESEKRAIYQTLIPPWIFDVYQIDPSREDDYAQVRYMTPTGSRAMELDVRRHPADPDPLLYMNMADTFNHQLLVLLVVVNDPDAPRFNVD